MRRVLDDFVAGHRVGAGTAWPIVDQLVEERIEGEPTVWLIVRSLCNGVSDGADTYEDMREALDAWRLRRGP